MTAFARAAAALHQDRNLSVLCTYKPSDAPMTLSVRVIRSSPIDGFGDLSGSGSTARREEASIAIGAISTVPKRGDSFAIGRDEFQVEDVKLDPEGTAYVLTLSRDS